MTTLNGAIRTFSAAVKRAERDQQRRAREAAKFHKLQQKQQDAYNASEAVRQYSNYIDIIQSVHKEVSEQIDWTAILHESEPVEPSLKNALEQQARNIKLSYVPSFFDKLFGKDKSKLKRFDDGIANAINRDRSIHDQKLKEHKENLKEWHTLQRITKGIINKVPESYLDAMEYFKPFSDIAELGTNLNLHFETNHIVVDIHVNGINIIPDYVLSLTTTGKLSRKSMPVSKFNELYQDHVCSSVLRVARESLALLPINYVVVNAIGNLLNSSTGRVEEQAILSAAIYPETFRYINFQSIDPSDSMRNFIHNMKFSKTGGFSPVEKVDPYSLN